MTAREVLQRLVACDDLLRELNDSRARDSDVKSPCSIELERDYDARAPLAWNAALAYLAQPEPPAAEAPTRRPRELIVEIELARQEGWRAGAEYGWKQGRANALEEVETERAAKVAAPSPAPADTMQCEQAARAYLARPEPQTPELSPYFALLDYFAPARWRCTKCGCLWRLNAPFTAGYRTGERSWSLFDAKQKACATCDNSPEFLSVIEPDPKANPRILYEELLYAVAQKLPHETRHQTALRYIREREGHSTDPGAAQAKENEK